MDPVFIHTEFNTLEVLHGRIGSIRSKVPQRNRRFNEPLARAPGDDGHPAKNQIGGQLCHRSVVCDVVGSDCDVVALDKAVFKALCATPPDKVRRSAKKRMALPITDMPPFGGLDVKMTLGAERTRTRASGARRFLSGRRREFPTIGPGQNLSNAQVEP